MNKQRLAAGLLALGACVLIFRTAHLTYHSGEILMWWVLVLTGVEALIDVICLGACIRWFTAGDGSRSSLALRTGASAAILHAFRVLIYALGRMEPFRNFDRQSEFRAIADAPSEMGWVYFAAIMSVLGIIGVLVIWRVRKGRVR